MAHYDLTRKCNSLQNSDGSKLVTGLRYIFKGIIQMSVVRFQPVPFRYRQKSLQEEIDKNHDDLWEEQIARAKERSAENKRYVCRQSKIDCIKL